MANVCVDDSLSIGVEAPAIEGLGRGRHCWQLARESLSG